MSFRFTTACLLLAACLPPSLQADLVNGPMLTRLGMREATVWVQADEPSVVRVQYASEGDTRWSAPVETNDAAAHTAAITLAGVEPGRDYRYQIEIDGKLSDRSHRFTSPAFFHDRSPPPDLRVAVGGAHYVVEEGFEPPYRILGGGYGIFETIAEQEPDLMLWVGNTAHLRPSDWGSPSGYLKRFATARSVPELQPLLASIPHYAVWSEHDYGQPAVGRHYSYRRTAESAFRAFWPQPPQVPGLDGLSGHFQRSDVDFFFLDVRSYRDDAPASDKSPAILGEAQIEWLRNALLHSSATFKVVVAGAPVLNPADHPANLSYAESEHTRLLQMLRNERISGLFFLSGGKYYGELTRLVHANSYNLHDLTVGPLTAEPRENDDELNFFRMPRSSTFERHFALLDFTGPEEARELTIRVMSMEGDELWNRTIQAAELQSAD
ncbi:MAG: alkaline phosphatase D family protein [Opitutales bacterium]